MIDHNEAAVTAAAHTLAAEGHDVKAAVLEDVMPLKYKAVSVPRRVWMAL